MIACVDVYANTGAHAHTHTTPYLLDGLGTRVVIPLRSLRHFPTVQRPDRLTPVLSVHGEDFLLETPKLGAVPLRALKAPVASLVERQADITEALDFLFQGY